MVSQSRSIEEITQDIFKMTLEDEVMDPEQHLIPPGAVTTMPSIIPPGPAPPLQFDDTLGTLDSTFTALALIDHELHE